MDAACTAQHRNRDAVLSESREYGILVPVRTACGFSLSLSAVGTLSLSRIRGDRRGVYRVKPFDNPFVCLSLEAGSRLALFFVLPGGAARAIGEKGFCKFVV